MQLEPRGRVPALAVLFSMLSIGLIFAAVLGAIPAGLFPRNDALIAAIPHLNAVISLTAIVTILTGVRAIRRGAVARHRTAMLTTTLLFAGFLGLYLYRLILEGTTVFAGPQLIRQFVYLPVLAIHILLAIVCIPFVYYALLLADEHPVSKLPETPHPLVGKIAASLWLVSFALGIVVYLLLYILF